MISCNITYYNDPKWLLWWYQTFKQFYLDRIDIQLNIADDGSQVYPAEDFFDQFVPSPNMRLFRVKEDIGFNSHGARNLLMKQTQTEWNMLSDIDREYPMQTLKSIIKAEQEGTLKRGEYYNYSHEKHGDPSCNEYLVSKTDFWKSGGYDEEFVNIHWGDRIFFDESLSRVAKRIHMVDWKIRYTRGARDWQWTDNPTTIYPDDNTILHPRNEWATKESREAIIHLVKTRNRTHEGRISKKVINFDWEQVF